jgi:hypothetical protein
MNEQLLHFVWRNGLFSKSNLKTTDGDRVEIIDPGRYNRDSGPDFLNSRLKIGATEWAGNVEIHYRSSSWYEHKHHHDKAYNNVILHTVVINDSKVNTEKGICPDTLVLKINPGVIQRYEDYMLDESVISCKDDLRQTDSFFIRHWINMLAVKRLEKKTSRIRSVLVQTKYDWEEVLYRIVARTFGMNVNKDPFEQLASRVPLKLIRRHSDNLIQVESLLFGQAGFLIPDILESNEKDDYWKLLYREYSILKSKYNLIPLDPWIWKFHRMRPVNFPTRRISQLAFLMHKQSGLFRKIIDTRSLKEIIDLLKTKVSEYWLRHYRFGKVSPEIPGEAGDKLLETIVVNSIVPLIWLYGNIYKEGALCDKALELSDAIAPENNRIVREWINSGFTPRSSFESQGLIELTESYCKNRMCLNCHIGTKLISLGREFDAESNLILGEPLE